MELLCDKTINFNLMSDLYAEQFGLTALPVNYRQNMGLAYCCREPYRSEAMMLDTRRPVSLACDELGTKISVQCEEHKQIGFLYAADADWLSLLFRFYQQAGIGQLPDAINVAASVLTIQKTPMAHQPSDRRKKFLKINLAVTIELRDAWPLFTILAILCIRDPNRIQFLVEQNPWLEPLSLMQHQYQTQGHDRFDLPLLLAETWMMMTQINDMKSS